MRLRVLFLSLLSAGVSGAAAIPVAAQCMLCAVTATDGRIAAREAETPLRVEVETQLDLGRVAAGAAGGAVELDPVSGSRRLSGDLVDLGGFSLSGSVSVRGAPGAAVRVILPATVDLESEGGRNARVTGLVTDLPPAPRLGPDGRLRFRFGGRLQVAGLGDGDYRGRIPVTVEYQ
ncbi:MAG: DUF4402 domain-containing protein [Sphingopyxis sp.]|uniref:DUF4402 domain-containing protein n=1 Tax=Sphingopyxis sp. TaxID=1908224 RepID=UPI002AB953BD|nr:DUF4402 domain-containing protein [Sphingopyxis sp.]MDZ3832139.1 DUF4402 domain-containing protein [Sphingopyxis sp.]